MDIKEQGVKGLLKKSFLVSFTLHALLLGSLCFFIRSDSTDKAAGVGDSGFAIYVELIGTPSTTEFEETFPVATGNVPIAGGSKKSVTASQQAPSEVASLAVGAMGEGGEEGSSDILRQIRNKIERAKYYPLMAKRSQTEGSPLVEFKIKNDGALEYVLLKESSGFKILDDAATQTVQEAQPFPYYPEPIALHIHYALTH